MIESDEGMKPELSDDTVLGNILGDIYGITFWIDVVTELCSLDGFFDGSNDGKLDRLLLIYSLVYTDGKVIGSDEGIKLGYNDGKVLGTILGNGNVITLGLDV